MTVELKIKAKHLAAEAKIIRFEENKYKERIKNTDKLEQKEKLTYTFQSLRNHRRFDVKNEARATHLARAFIKGVSYSSVERKRLDDYHFRVWILPRIHMMAMKYGNRKTTIEDIKSWVGLN